MPLTVVLEYFGSTDKGPIASLLRYTRFIALPAVAAVCVLAIDLEIAAAPESDHLTVPRVE
jgi:hypothetical protein